VKALLPNVHFHPMQYAGTLNSSHGDFVGIAEQAGWQAGGKVVSIE